MTDREPDSLDLESALVDLIDGSATAHDLHTLNEALLKSPELRRRASRFLCDEAVLADHLDLSERRLAVVSAAKKSRRRPIFALESLRAIDRRGGLIAIAASLIVAVLAIDNAAVRRELQHLHSIAVLDVAENASVADAPKGAAAGSPVEVGRVAGMDDAVWGNGQSPLRFGDVVSQGQTLNLRSGVVEILMVNGAMVTVEGPAKLEATSPTESGLSIGKLAAAVPRTARGYTVLTPTSELVDIGTQFGVSVDDSGASELHVFEGDVVARSTAAGEQELVHAKESEAMRFASDDATPSRIAARADHFVRRIKQAASDGSLPGLPLTRDLSLWLTAEAIQGAEPGHRVSAWRDLLVGDNRFPDDAWQFVEQSRPKYVVDSRGRPALRFDGWSTWLMTGPMKSSPQRTILVACAPAPTQFASDYHGGILVKYGDAPSLEFAILPDFSPRGWVWPGPNRGANTSTIRGEPIPSGQPSLLGYVHDSKTSTASLWVNGARSGPTTAPTALPETAQAFIGSHRSQDLPAKFFGLIHEIVVYDSVLTDEEMGSVTRYFASRYGFESPVPAAEESAG